MNKKQLIYDAVLKISNEGGLSSTPMSKIAKEAGVAAGTIYRYFENKDCLLLDLYMDINKDLIQIININYNEASPSKANIEKVWKSILNFYLENPLWIKFIQEYRASYNLSKEVIDSSSNIYSLMKKIFDKALEEGAIKKLSCLSLSSFIMGPINELFYYNTTGIAEVNQNIINESFEILWSAIGADV